MVATNPRTPPALEWVQIGRDLWRSVGSRFDLIHVPGGRGVTYWLAIDADTGRTHRDRHRVMCEAWCAAMSREGVAL